MIRRIAVEKTKRKGNRAVQYASLLLLPAMAFVALQKKQEFFPIGPAAPLMVVSSGTIHNGGSLFKSLAREGLGAGDIDSVSRALSSQFNPRLARSGHRYELSRTTAGAFVKLRYWTDPISYYSVKKTTEGRLSVKSKMLAVVETTMSIVGTVQSSLWESMIHRNVAPELIYQYADVFAWRIDFMTEPRAGDQFKIVWVRKEAGPSFKDGAIIGASYEGRETGKVVAIKYQDGYYAPDGTSLKRQFLRAPLRFRAISSYFRNRRFHPILRVNRPHHGIDYAAAKGTPVLAIGDGVVVKKGWKGGNGNLVKIRHRNSKYSSVYAHLSRYGKGIAPGKSVKQGQVIGYVGSTGLSTGPHLHFGLEMNNRPVNFLAIKPPALKHLSGRAVLENFARHKSAILPYLDTVVTVEKTDRSGQNSL